MGAHLALSVLLVSAGVTHGAVAQQPSSPGEHPANGISPQLAATADGSYAVEYRWDEAAPREGQFQVLRLSVISAPAGCRTGLNMSVDAAMPGHGHGLNYHPVVTVVKANREFVARGLMFHMSGAWELYVDVACGGTSTRLTIPLSVP